MSKMLGETETLKPDRLYEFAGLQNLIPKFILD